MTKPSSHVPIAIVGLSALFPGSTDKSGFWRDILAGRDLITDVPPGHWLIEDYYDPDPSAPDKTYARRGAFLEKSEFDPLRFGVPPSIVPATDSAQILALIVAQRVLDDASQGQFETMDRERMSVILGVTSAQELLGSMVSRLQRPIWEKSLRDAGIPESKVKEVCQGIADHYVPWQESTFPGLLGNVVAGRIANRLDLGGTNCVTDAACASAFSAVSMGVNELYLGQSDIVITGGVDTMNDIFMYMCFSKTPALSPTGDCRPFSDQADGTLLGEGLGMVALKRLEDAERDGDRVYAVLQAVAASSDGRANSVYAPRSEGQAKAIRRAYGLAGYSPDTVELVEAHGTGTKAGDAAEFAGLKMAFEESEREDRQWCALGSVKSQIGHTKAAAGAAGLFKTVMAIHHKVLPPTIKVDRPNPKLSIGESPFYLNTKARPWIRRSDHPRRGSISSFGFGGSNFHVALEEYTGDGNRAYRNRAMPSELVVLGAASPTALVEKIRAVTVGGERFLSWFARETQEGFDPASTSRVAIVAVDDAELVTKLAKAAELIEKNGEKPFSSPLRIHYANGAEPGDVAFLFPGQGSQYLEMGADLAMSYDDAIAAWDLAADMDVGEASRIPDVVFPQPVFSDEERDQQSAELVETQWAQPAIGTASLAQLNVLETLGIEPACVGGHSYGEVTALHAGGAIDAETMLRIARKRGELMKEAASIPGSMTAVVATIEEVREIVKESKAAVVVANHNSPKQVVVSGKTEAIEAIEVTLAEQGVSFKRLPVATAFHSEVVSESTKPFAKFLAAIELKKPKIPVYANSEAAPYPSGLAKIRKILANQIASPVRFLEQVEAMYESGVRTFLEVGPDAVLSNLVGRILKGRDHQAIPLDRKKGDGVTSFHEAIGRLVVSGVGLDLTPLWRDYLKLDDPREVKKPAMAIAIDGTNYQKPYPPKGGAVERPAPNPELVPEVIVKEVIREVPVPVPVATAAKPVTSPIPAAAAAGPGAWAAATAAPAISPTDQMAWVAAYQELQRQTAEVHASWQQAMAQTHTAFLQTAEKSFGELSAMVTGGLVVAGASAALTLPAHAAIANPAGSAEGPRVPQAQELTADIAQLQAPVAPTIPTQPVAAVNPFAGGAPGMPAMPAPPAPVQAPAPMVAAAPAADLDLQALLLEVVADKTGYPAEMLNMEMGLEADLGIDSIKRVEILAAMREQAPQLPEVDTSAMADLRTLGQIVGHMKGQMGVTDDAPAASPSVAAPAPAAEVVASAPEDVDLQALLLEVVADKTGYPSDMLQMEMELEADLGIDSIKRVEILASMRERLPHLPEVDTQVMGSLRTLGQIVEHMQPGDVAAAVTSSPSPSIDAANMTASTAMAATGLGRYAVKAVNAPEAGLAMPGLADASSVAITDDGGGVAQSLASKLTARGLDATVVDQPSADAGVVILLQGLRDVGDVGSALELNREAFRSARTIAPGFTKNGGVFVTVQDTGGDFGLSGSDRAWFGGLAGLAKTAALEWPEAAVKAIDVDRAGKSADEVAEALVHELFFGGPEIEVGLGADGERSTLRAVASEAPAKNLVIDGKSVLVASGGARGVTASTLIELAKVAKPRIALLGRTALEMEPAPYREAKDDAALKRAIMVAAKADGRKIAPAAVGAEARRVLAVREIRETLDALEEAGSTARYIALDVQDPESVKGALSEIRSAWGPITGLIHGAGVLADRLIAEKTDEQFDRVFNTKIQGLRTLLDATAADPLSAMCLFSSVAARTGNTGQSDYSMANEIMNKVASLEARRRGDACVVKSLNWGPWDGGMVTPQLKAHFTAMGVPLIPLGLGAEMMQAELSVASGDAVEVVIGGPTMTSRVAVGSEKTFDVMVDKATHPYLADHAIQNVPVVPVVMVLEWFARTAKATNPDLEMVGCRNMKVLKGIRLPNFQNGRERLQVNSKLLSNGSGVELGLELRGSDGTLHYTADVEMAEAAPVPNGTKRASLKLEKWDADIYGDVLFHGPDFQVIKELDGVSEQGIAAVLSGTRERGWSGEWRTDMAALDGGLQLALLWSGRVLGGKSLPTAVGSYQGYLDRLPEGPIRCELRGEVVGKSKTVSDIVFTSSDGEVVAELRGVETHLLPS